MINTYIVIPTFNEQTRLPQLLGKIQNYISLNKVIVVDDGSNNRLRINKKFPVTLLTHQINLGKGAAMKTGAEYAFEHKADAVIFMDADLQHDPTELPSFLDQINSGYDVVFGSRKQDLDTPLVRYLGNKFASLYIRFVFGVYVSDILSGFRALSLKAYKILKWDSDRYGVETEIIARLGLNKRRLTWIEVPISTIYMDKYKGVSLVTAVKILVESAIGGSSGLSTPRGRKITHMVETFLGIQVISILFGLFMMYLIRVHYKRNNIGLREYIIWNICWISFLVFALIPHILTPVITTLKIVRVLDLVMVMAFMILTYIAFSDHMAIRDLYRQINKLVSDKAKKTARKV